MENETIDTSINFSNVAVYIAQAIINSRKNQIEPTISSILAEVKERLQNKE